MRLATWNVNSARARQFRMIDWFDRVQPDVACLQETKVSDEEFAALYDEDLFRRGYSVAHHGEGRWNGVAVVSRVGLSDVARWVPEDAAYPSEARAVAATCGSGPDTVRVWSVYVPNGRTPTDPHYQYKLRWLAGLRVELAAETLPLVVSGDFNIAPADADVWDPAEYVGATHVTPPERAALAEVASVGLVDVLRRRWPDQRVFTYWDYRAGMFHKDFGMRIDLVLASPSLADRVVATWVDRQARKGKEPSDHAPVVVDLDVARDGDIGPVVPPPSASVASKPRGRIAMPPRER